MNVRACNQEVPPGKGKLLIAKFVISGPVAIQVTVEYSYYSCMPQRRCPLREYNIVHYSALNVIHRFPKEIICQFDYRWCSAHIGLLDALHFWSLAPRCPCRGPSFRQVHLAELQNFVD